MSNLLRRVGHALRSESSNQPRGAQCGQRDNNRASRVPFGVLLVSLSVGGVALLLALNTASAANELRRHDLADQDTSVAAHLQQVHNQVAASAAPGNLGRAARALGMVAADNPAFIVLEPDGSVRVLGRPGVAQGPAPAAPKPTAKPKPKPSTTSAKSTQTAKSTTKSKTHGHVTAQRSPSPHPTTSHPTTPKPTPTPTPTVTLPGGNR